MRRKKQEGVKGLFTVLLVVVLAVSFRAALLSARKTVGCKVTTEISRGLHTAALFTTRGNIKVYFPADMAAGEKISVSVYANPVGRTKEEKTKNLAELDGFVVEIKEIKGKLTPGTQKRNSRTIPGTINGLHLVFKDREGVEVGSTKIPVHPEPPVSRPADFILPTIGQAGSFLKVPGPFDGDFNSTGVRIGDFDAEILAESPRGLIVFTPNKVIGRTEIILKEGAVEAAGKYRSVSVIPGIGKSSLQPGETTTLMVTVKGLEVLEDEVPFRLENKSAGIIRMEGGSIQTRIIRPGDIKTGGIYTLTRTLTGKVAGSFRISARIYPELKDCTEKSNGAGNGKSGISGVRAGKGGPGQVIAFAFGIVRAKDRDGVTIEIYDQNGNSMDEQEYSADGLGNMFNDLETGDGVLIDDGAPHNPILFHGGTPPPPGTGERFPMFPDPDDYGITGITGRDIGIPDFSGSNDTGAQDKWEALRAIDWIKIWLARKYNACLNYLSNPDLGSEGARNSDANRVKKPRYHSAWVRVSKLLEEAIREASRCNVPNGKLADAYNILGQLHENRDNSDDQLGSYIRGIGSLVISAGTAAGVVEERAEDASPGRELEGLPGKAEQAANSCSVHSNRAEQLRESGMPRNNSDDRMRWLNEIEYNARCANSYAATAETKAAEAEGLAAEKNTAAMNAEAALAKIDALLRHARAELERAISQGNPQAQENWQAAVHSLEEHKNNAAPNAAAARARATEAARLAAEARNHANSAGECANAARSTARRAYVAARGEEAPDDWPYPGR